MWARSASLKNNTERTTKKETIPKLYTQQFRDISFWQVFVVRPPICTFYLKYWDKGLIDFAQNNELQAYAIAV